MTIGIEGYDFTGPVLMGAAVPRGGGVYAILSITDSGKYRLLYVGETEDFSSRGIHSGHHAYRCWKEQANEGALYMSFYGAKEDRESIEAEIIRQQGPPCNG